MIVNCPHCSGPIFKSKTEEDMNPLDIELKCPHCRKTLELCIRREIIIVINGKKIEKIGEPRIRTL